MFFEIRGNYHDKECARVRTYTRLKLFQVRFISDFFFFFFKDENRKKTCENHPKPWQQCPFPGLLISPHISSPGSSSVSTSQTRCAKPLSTFLPSIFLSDLHQFPGMRVSIRPRTDDETYLFLSDFINFLNH